MQDENEVKEIVKEKYGNIAKATSKGCGCGCGSNNKIIGYTMKDNYDNIKGYVADADLGLGCGLPTEFAGIKEGDTVVDLGSGAGNDVFVARAIVGETGKVIGIDMTPEMIEKANRNKAKLGYANVEFHLAEIEKIPLEDASVDVVVSNCVLNLVPNKVNAFKEIYRILKPGAKFCISDIVLEGELPASLQKSAEMYAGCIAGALQKDDYLKLIEETGFKNVEVKKTKVIDIPEKLILQYLDSSSLQKYHENKTAIYSITIVGYKLADYKN